MNDTLFEIGGLALSTVAIILTINANSRKQGERMAILETTVIYLKEAVNDLKKSAGLNRRCTDCEKPLTRDADS